MITVYFIRTNNEKVCVEVPEGTTLMQAAREAKLREIPADCGGNCACATCHVYIDDRWLAKHGKVCDNTPEIDLLEYESGFKDGVSRLACQITLTQEDDGLIVKLRNDELL